MENRTFDPGGSQGHLRACPILGPWRVLACGEAVRDGDSWGRAAAFFFADSLYLFEARPALYCATEGGSRLHKQVGRIEVTPSRRLEVIDS